MIVTLRPVAQDDLDIFFEQGRDPEACYLAAFTAKDPNDRAAFDAHWMKILADTANINMTVLCDGQPAGNISSFEYAGEREVSYWIGREYWGKGVATQALTLFLSRVSERPLFARVVSDNLASRRVLEKCGFQVVGQDTGYANARGAEVEEFILRLDA